MRSLGTLHPGDLEIYCDPLEILWDSDPCPCGMEVVSQGSSPRRPGPLIQCEWDTVVNKTSWSLNWRCKCSLLARGLPSPGAGAGGDLTVTDRELKHRPCVIEKFQRWGLLDSRTLPWFLLWSLRSFVNVSTEYWLWKISESRLSWYLPNYLTSDQSWRKEGFEDEVL